MTVTALDLITGAARLIGVVSQSEPLAADEANDGLVALNDLLASWSNDSLMTFVHAWESFSLQAGVAAYLIGSGQTFNTARPISIAAAFTRLNGVDEPLTIIPAEEYGLNIPDKDSPGPYGDYLTYDNAYPYGTIRLYPVPSGSSELHLLTRKPLDSFSALTTQVSLPPGWSRAIRYNLAIDMAPEYEVEPTAGVIAIARSSLALLRRAASANTLLPFRGESLPTGNIYSGYF